MLLQDNDPDFLDQYTNMAALQTLETNLVAATKSGELMTLNDQQQSLLEQDPTFQAQISASRGIFGDRVKLSTAERMVPWTNCGETARWPRRRRGVERAVQHADG